VLSAGEKKEKLDYSPVFLDRVMPPVLPIAIGSPTILHDAVARYYSIYSNLQLVISSGNHNPQPPNPLKQMHLSTTTLLHPAAFIH